MRQPASNAVIIPPPNKHSDGRLAHVCPPTEHAWVENIFHVKDVFTTHVVYTIRNTLCNIHIYGDKLTK